MEFVKYLIAPYLTYTNTQIALESTAAIFGIVSVICAINKNIGVYPLGILSTAIYSYLLWQWGLLGEMLINVYYTIMSVYGWKTWTSTSKKSHSENNLTQHSLEKPMNWIHYIFILMISFIAVVCIYSYLYKGITAIPMINYLDSLATSCFLLAMYLMANKRIESWVLWMIGNSFAIVLFSVKGYGITAIQYVVFLILAYIGWRAWRKVHRIKFNHLLQNSFSPKLFHPMRIRTLSDYQCAYQKSIETPELFWNEIASNFQWRQKWDNTLEWNFTEPNIKWFVNGKLNITENCIDRHVATQPDKIAIIWEPNEVSETFKSYTYRQLYHEVCRFANVLKSMGVQKGDRVCIYLPMIPELAFAVLACARIGAVHSVVFAGFSASAIADRVLDAQARYIITSDGMSRGSKTIQIKEIVDEAISKLDIVKNVLVVNRMNSFVQMNPLRDVWYHELAATVSADCPAEEMDSEDMLFILYTSGSTGKPKGVVHTCGGYMVYTAYTFANVFQYEPDEIHWCTADIGWVTGHSYILYGPLANGATTLLFEGIPTYPEVDRFWSVCEKHKVNIFYTAPTAIRSLMAYGTEPVDKHQLTSLRKLGSVGEPINLEAYHWFKRHVGKGRCPVVDTWWQTETGGIMISTMAGVTESPASFAGYPIPGIQLSLVTPEGKPLEGNDVEGYLCIDYPWPSILRTTYGDHERCRTNYFATYQDKYFTGDGVYRDCEGRYRIIGRVDDVINVSGHRLGTAELENAIDENVAVIEAAVVGFPHDIKGQGIYAFVILESNAVANDKTKKSIIDTLVKEIGSIAKPDKIQFVIGLPKTRSGKIMRRILRKIAEGDTSNLGDISTLIDPTIVEKIKQGAI